jgi:hypothetical protein
MVHYPVVNGKPGRRSETPLSVMVHNNEPYRVEVNVKGNRIVTSFEGQEVDSWTDKTLAKGGVGFFSEAEEKARLYWVRLAANDDLWGHVCAYVAGAAGRPASAQVQYPHAPGRDPLPGGPEAPAALAASLGFRRRRRTEHWD